jgi:hypothetical protein
LQDYELQIRVVSRTESDKGNDDLVPVAVDGDSNERCTTQVGGKFVSVYVGVDPFAVVSDARAAGGNDNNGNVVRCVARVRMVCQRQPPGPFSNEVEFELQRASSSTSHSSSTTTTTTTTKTMPSSASNGPADEAAVSDPDDSDAD